MNREAFERLVRETAYRPTTREAILSELERQTIYHTEPPREGLEGLADALTRAFAGSLGEAERLLTALASQYREQPLCHYYLFAVQRQAGDVASAKRTLGHLRRIDPGDPMVDLLHMDLAGKPIPGITEEVRLANIRKLASTPFLKNPYQLAVGAIFEEIQDREQARVLDVGVGSGAQMVELLGLLQREPHRLRRLEVVGLDFVQQFLETAGRNILARAQELAGRVTVSYRPVQGRIEALDGATLRAITSDGPLDAANASIALHEVPGEAKWAALRNLRALAPMRFVLVEWNYCLENVLPETTAEFLFNVRRVAAAMVAVLREQ
ncbi:MAG: class I SAM-dependent methyltransferase, partial [candidate division NC10 bacterium]|nr:class I SAM-dependent methyltransferase [candidate division NC10 bacterium]